VSDQDFFFDEEPEAPKPAGKGTKPASPPAAPPAKATASKAAPAKPAAPVAEVDTEPSASFIEQPTTWAIASLLAVAGLLLGAILGYLLGIGMAKPAAVVPAATSPAATVPAASGTPAVLTTEQIQAGMPAGHPAVSVPSSGSADTTK
jgi:hypothetical protein